MKIEVFSYLQHEGRLCTYEVGLVKVRGHMTQLDI